MPKEPPPPSLVGSAPSA
uniref:60S ribosomal protein L12 n=1 Tax=Rhizophora mucronata TaxID=61149 RepID=A0A2P2QUC3_RHIMU